MLPPLCPQITEKSWAASVSIAATKSTLAKLKDGLYLQKGRGPGENSGKVKSPSKSNYLGDESALDLLAMSVSKTLVT